VGIDAAGESYFSLSLKGATAILGVTLRLENTEVWVRKR
jgi:hypothetical protein